MKMLEPQAKTIHLLIGPKGAGKTFIGSTLHRRLGVYFLRVEPIWLSLVPGEDGWRKVELEIDHLLQDLDEIIIESLGAGDGFLRFRDQLSRKYRLCFIKVVADLDECLRRVRTRDTSDHIPVSDSDVERYNTIAAKVQHPWSCIIRNDGPASEDEIVRAFQSIKAEQGGAPNAHPRHASCLVADAPGTSRATGERG